MFDDEVGNGVDFAGSEFVDFRVEVLGDFLFFVGGHSVGEFGG